MRSLRCSAHHFRWEWMGAPLSYGPSSGGPSSLRTMSRARGLPSSLMPRSKDTSMPERLSRLSAMSLGSALGKKNTSCSPGTSMKP